MATPYVISSDLVSAYPAKSLEIAQYIDGFKADLALVQNAQTGTTYTFVATDFTKLVTASNAAASTYTIPPQSSVTWPANTLLRVTNLGAGVVTFAGGVGVTVTNTAATLSQFQTATLVRTGSDAWTVIRQGANAPGMDLITPTSVAGSGVTLSGGEVTFSAAATVSLNGCFTSAYANYRIALDCNTPSSSSIVSMRLRAAGTDTSTNYVGSFVRFDASTSAIAYETAVTDRLKIGVARVTVRSVLDALIVAPQLSTYTGISASANDENQAAIVGGQHKAATSFDGFTLLPASGTLTGTVRVYGLRNS